MIEREREQRREGKKDREKEGGCGVMLKISPTTERRAVSSTSVFAIFAAFSIMHGGTRPYKWMTKKDVRKFKKTSASGM